jgi:peptide/nickel transport system substrate-binding protein
MPERKLHQAVPELQDQYRKGKMTRREFIRYVTLLGTSLAAAQTLAAQCGAPATPPPTEAPPAATPAPTKAPAAVPKRGGTIRVSSLVKRVDHPARLSWISPSNQLRQVLEYLTYTDKNNLTHPYLLEKWEASTDLETWTLFLRKGVKWNNGDDFIADDVVFTLKQWLDKDVGSSILGLMSYLTANGVEKVDDHTVKLNLESPEIAVPEHLFHYPAMVLHRAFEGDILKKPVGTGPFTLAEFKEGERVVLKRRDGYWQKDANGEALPYLDEIIVVDLGEEASAHIAALKAGQVDRIDTGEIAPLELYQGLKDEPSVRVIGVTTAETRVLRMRVDKKPWDNPQVCMALKLCQNREKILKLAYFSEGALGQDVHVSPVHPDYCERPVPKYDPEKAKQLLAEAGYPDGIDVEMAVATGWPEVVSQAEVLKEDATAAGFRIKLNAMPVSAYWDLWTEADLGITPWAHRPLGTMVLALAYIADKDGKPVPWNETRWVDAEFSKLLQEASGTLDVAKRREIFCKLEEIQWERGSIGIPYWMNLWSFANKKFENIDAHPSHYANYTEVWRNPEA